MLTALLTILGLAIFETVSSLDNAIINAQVLNTMQTKARRWFLTWGMAIAVFGVRGLLPLIIVWLLNPSLGLFGSVTATFTGDQPALDAIKQSAPVLLIAGGIFMVFLFMHWLFLEVKQATFAYEAYLGQHKSWFYAVISILLAVMVWLAIQVNDLMAFGAVVGSTVFFISHGFKQHAEAAEKNLLANSTSRSDWSKILYLEAIDTSFSIDGVLGAFAFTLSIPLILVGNGIGAILVRQLTIHNLDKVQKYIYLKNGAMYSIFILGLIMIGHAFGYHIPEWLTPLSTMAIVSYFFYKSTQVLNKNGGS